MIGRLWRRWRERVEARRARVLRHTYAPRLEAFREITQLPEVAPTVERKVLPFKNLLVKREARIRRLA